MATLKAIWWKLYPNDDDKHRWAPLIWLPFMIWFFVDPASRHTSLLGWVANTFFGLVFILLYLQAFSHRDPYRLVCVLAMTIMAIILIPLNGGAIAFLVYAAAVGGFDPDLRKVSVLIALQVAVLALNAYRLQLPLGAWGSMLLLITIVGFGNHYWALNHCASEKLRLANDEIEHLAKVAERERIARDLHDLLGHTLSLITLKAELARKLVDRDPQRAEQEMQDIEQTSRAALADVREAISGYRGQGFAAELVRARQTLETAGISVDCDASAIPLSPAQESVLALALREAVTNVVRHAQAQRCIVRLARDQQTCTLEIADNGRGADAPEGNGLRGMRERLEAIGGSLQRRTSAGTQLVIHLPLAPAAPALRN
jgi:two-component system sensor histidine kinase DesK